MIKLLIVDDHNLFRHGLRLTFEKVEDIDVVGEVPSGEKAFAFCRSHPVDIVLMDLRMPGMGGVEATRRITQGGASAQSGTRVLALTGSTNEHIGHQFLNSGASGFVSKDTSFPDLLRAIRSVFDGGLYLCGEMAGRMIQYSGRAETSPFALLTQRELQICQMIVECKKISYIANKLHLSPKTVNTYRYRIFEKLAVSGDVELVHLAHRFGLIELGVLASG